jgi:hypothetical protein
MVLIGVERLSEMAPHKLAVSQCHESRVSKNLRASSDI